MMVGVAGTAGWSFDADSLQEVVTDRAAVQAALDTADPPERLRLLRLLGRHDQAIAEGARLLEDPVVRQDPWQALLLIADLHRDRMELEQAERVQTLAWRHARSRSRQATTLQHIGQRWWVYNDRDVAASCFQLALTMRRGFAEPELVQHSRIALEQARKSLAYDAIVLAGGRGSRFAGGVDKGGVDKAGLPLADWPLVDHVLLAVSGATNRIVAGPRRIALGEPVFCREDPPGAGPVAAIAAAVGSLGRDTRNGQQMVAVLAADVPFVGPALDTLRECITFGNRDAAVLVDITGRPNHLASMWRAASLLSALERLGDPVNAPVKALYEGVDTAFAPDFDANGADCDTPDQLREAEERVRRRSPGQLPAALLAWPRLELHSPS